MAIPKNYEFHRDFPVQKLIVLPQIRKAENARIDEIAASIQIQGLLNPINIVRLTHEEFVMHIKTINWLWKKEIQIDDYQADDGYYYVVVAGHSRLAAIKKLDEPTIDVKLHDVHTSEEILAIQIGENIYSEPPVEEKVIAIIETYRLGLLNGKWKDKNEFKKNNETKFSKYDINNAMLFENLPKTIQSSIFRNRLPYSIGVDLGTMYPLIAKYEAAHADTPEEVAKNIELYYHHLVTGLYGISGVKKKKERIAAALEQLADYFREKDELADENLMWFLGGIETQGQDRRKQLLANLRALKTELTAGRLDILSQILEFDTALTGDPNTAEVATLRSIKTEYAQTKLLGM